MAKSKYEYVREFEAATDSRLLPDSYVVVRVDGQCFHRFAKEHQFLKPNDKRALDLMNKSALHVMRTFYPNIIMAYGQSDEYSFIIRRLAYFFNRRTAKITSLITSAFTSAFVFYWPRFFCSSQNRSLTFRRYDQWNPSTTTFSSNSNSNIPDWTSVPLKYPPSFDGRAVLYPNERTLTDYLRWRQVDCHINNLYNTAFYALTGEYTRYVPDTSNSSPSNSPPTTYNLFLGDPSAKALNRSFYSHAEATQRLSGSSSADKNELMFTDYGVNYNDELQQFRKGTAIVLTPPQADTTTKVDLPETPAVVIKPSKSALKRSAKVEEDFAALAIDQQERFFTTLHTDIIREDGDFWTAYSHLLKL